MARRKLEDERYDYPTGGWGSVKSLVSILAQEHIPIAGSRILGRQNKPGGFMCVSCSWAKPAEPHVFEFCENGAKATAWEVTDRRTTPAFFRRHTLTELRGWSDHDLEEHGRLTRPMRYDRESDRYVLVDWAEAFREIGAELRRLDPHDVVMYTSGRASLEASYMYQLFGRMYGTNNFPDSSNMCHESSSVALPESIGVGVGTVLLEDFERTDCIFFFGQNTGTNSPRMLHQLDQAVSRGVPIITFNPLRERGLERFINPQGPIAMLTQDPVRISCQYHQVRTGGDLAAIMGICKAVIAADDAAKAAGTARMIDPEFVEHHTQGFEEFAESARATDWGRIEELSGLKREDLEAAARVYMGSTSAMAHYGMGLTQQRHGVETVQMLVNMLLLRGNVGKPGSGISPVRGHSNVQGQRTVGITEKPKLVPLDRLAELYHFEPPRWEGLSTVDACKGIIDGKVKAFVSLGGNFLRAVPERGEMERAWQGMRLSVQIATKLNRTHLVPAAVTYLLPCLGRIEIDRQATGPQTVSMEDSTSCIHASSGVRKPAGRHILSEPAIVAGMAKATLPANPHVDWDGWVADYSRVRDAIEATWPDTFRDFNERFGKPGGFARPNGARERTWNTPTGKANFIWKGDLTNQIAEGPDVFQLMTLRSNSQFNTTIYSNDDRFRGIFGTREVVLMNPADMDRLGVEQGDRVTLVTAVDDGIDRRIEGLAVMPQRIPEGCIAAYYPECNVLVPLWHHAEKSKVPASKSVPVHIRR